MSMVRSIGGRTPRELGMIFLRQSLRPILPNTRDTIMPIPGRNGAWDFGADSDVRQFILECAFNARNVPELQSRIDALARMLVDNTGRPKSVELVFEVHPDRTFTVRYSGALPIERTAGLGRFALTLTAFDPFASGEEQLFESVITASPFVTEIESRGDIQTPPVIVLTNEGSDTITHFKITNEYRLE